MCSGLVVRDAVTIYLRPVMGQIPSPPHPSARPESIHSFRIIYNLTLESLGTDVQGDGITADLRQGHICYHECIL